MRENRYGILSYTVSYAIGGMDRDPLNIKIAAGQGFATSHRYLHIPMIIANRLYAVRNPIGDRITVLSYIDSDHISLERGDCHKAIS